MAGPGSVRRSGQARVWHLALLIKEILGVNLGRLSVLFVPGFSSLDQVILYQVSPLSHCQFSLHN